MTRMEAPGQKVAERQILDSLGGTIRGVRHRARRKGYLRGRPLCGRQTLALTWARRGL